LKSVSLKAPATIANFGPGFDIFAIALKAPEDNFRLTLRNDEKIRITVQGRKEEIPCDPEKNAAGIAAFSFLKRMRKAAGVNIEIEKNMKIASGLGTSGASAAATVYGLNILLETGLSDTEIVDIARQGETATGGAAHADNVAGCLLGGFIFIRNYKPLEICRLELPELPIVIAVMPKPQKTTRGFIMKKMSLYQVVDQMSWCAGMIHAVGKGDLKTIGQAVNSDHISEPVRGSFIPGYNEIKKNVLDAGAFGFNVSGGGSSVFAICEESRQNKIAELLKEEFNRQELNPEIIVTQASNIGVRRSDER
jgi:homoserine kinase